MNGSFNTLQAGPPVVRHHPVESDGCVLIFQRPFDPKSRAVP